MAYSFVCVCRGGLIIIIIVVIIVGSTRSGKGKNQNRPRSTQQSPRQAGPGWHTERGLCIEKQRPFYFVRHL